MGIERDGNRTRQQSAAKERTVPTKSLELPKAPNLQRVDYGNSTAVPQNKKSKKVSDDKKDNKKFRKATHAKNQDRNIQNRGDGAELSAGGREVSCLESFDLYPFVECMLAPAAALHVSTTCILHSQPCICEQLLEWVETGVTDPTGLTGAHRGSMIQALVQASMTQGSSEALVDSLIAYIRVEGADGELQDGELQCDELDEELSDEELDVELSDDELDEDMDWSDEELQGDELDGELLCIQALKSTAKEKPAAKKSTRKVHICAVCSYETEIKGSFEVHMRTHTGVKPYACNKCTFRAAQKGNLTRHILRHTGDKEFLELPPVGLGQ